jgi:hypothetical protein
MERPPLTERISFSFATTSTPAEPLLTWKHQLGTVWTSLDWLMLTRILKCDICVTASFILVLTTWGWRDVGTGMVLSSIAIEFIHPAGSYGRIWEVRSRRRRKSYLYILIPTDRSNLTCFHLTIERSIRRRHVVNISRVVFIRHVLCEHCPEPR